jgi:hypothetical protein
MHNYFWVAEAAFQDKLWSERIPDLCNLGNVYLIICEAEPNECAKRHLNRGLSDPTREHFHDDNRVKVFKET